MKPHCFATCRKGRAGCAGWKTLCYKLYAAVSTVCYELVLKAGLSSFTKAVFFRSNRKWSCSHMISPLFVVVPPPRFFQLADCSSGPTQPSLRTTAEKRNHLVPQASLALRKKTRSAVLSQLRWLYALDLAHRVVTHSPRVCRDFFSEFLWHFKFCSYPAA